MNPVTTNTRMGPRPRPRPNQPLGPRTSHRPPAEPTSSSPDGLYSPGAASPLYRPVSPARSDQKILPSISEAASLPTAAPVVPSPQNVTRAPSPKPVVKVIPKFIPFVPPKPINFDAVPIPWKSLPLEAALWTFTSRELQEIVSRSIRSSARESFIRLVSLENLDQVLPEELSRLESLKAMTQSKYRFLMHRRNMLFQGLNSSSQNDTDKDDGVSVVSKLTLQLCQTVTECDEALSQLLQINDQIGQINRLLDVHWASALAIALRKLNGSYGKRTADLVAARKRIKELEAELEDAWGQAEKMAQELDEQDELANLDIEEDIEEAVITTAEVVSVPQSPAMQHRGFPSPDTSISLEGTLRKLTPDDSTATDGRRVVDATEAEADVPDTVSVRSVRSTTSRKSTRSWRSNRSTSHLSTVSAARTRSNRASKSSLRLPSRFRARPPVPDLPTEYAPPPSSFMHSSASFTDDSKAETETVGPHRRVDIDEIEIVARDISCSSSVTGVSVDDVLIPERRMSDEIQVVPRIVPIRGAIDDIRVNARSRHYDEECDLPLREIPSIWRLADIPKTPAERVESLMRGGSTKLTSYHKLKTLTKRYSLPFPLFSAKSQARNSAAGQAKRSATQRTV